MVCIVLFSRIGTVSPSNTCGWFTAPVTGGWRCCTSVQSPAADAADRCRQVLAPLLLLLSVRTVSPRVLHAPAPLLPNPHPILYFSVPDAETVPHLTPPRLTGPPLSRLRSGDLTDPHTYLQDLVHMEPTQSSPGDDKPPSVKPLPSEPSYFNSIQSNPFVFNPFHFNPFQFNPFMFSPFPNPFSFPPLSPFSYMPSSSMYPGYNPFRIPPFLAPHPFSHSPPPTSPPSPPPPAPQPSPSPSPSPSSSSDARPEPKPTKKKLSPLPSLDKFQLLGNAARLGRLPVPEKGLLSKADLDLIRLLKLKCSTGNSVYCV